jgi:hypothetical protein
MIAAMPDFERIDRELAAIGSVPEAVQPLLDQYGQRDRSLENVDVVLTALREGRDPASSPPGAVIERPSFLPLGWDAERKSDPGIAAAPIPVAAVPQEEITVTTGLPDEMELPASEPPAAPAAPAFVESEAPAAIVSAEPAPEPEDPSEPVDTQESFPPPPADDPLPQVVSAAPEADSQSDALAEPKHSNRASRPPRADLQALLDTELDPREFPSTNPPPNLSRSLPGVSLPPPVPRGSLTPSEPEPQDFELLVDDDDIMEIDEEAE